MVQRIEFVLALGQIVSFAVAMLHGRPNEKVFQPAVNVFVWDGLLLAVVILVCAIW